MDSILTSIKKLLGITEEYVNFDPDITMHINTVFLSLKQLGVGPSEGFRIEDKTAKWEDFIKVEDDPEKVALLSAVKSYIHLKVKLLFDPPLSSAVMEAVKQSINELEWRLNVEAETETK
jgi:hypothetical protein